MGKYHKNEPTAEGICFWSKQYDRAVKTGTFHNKSYFDSFTYEDV